MDLYDAACSLQRAQERYLCWREMRAAVSALPAGADVPNWVRETALAIQAEADIQDSEQAGRWLTASESQVRDDLRRARVEHWYQQGKALRYALVLCRNRLERLAEQFGDALQAPSGLAPESAPESPEETGEHPRALRVLREQVDVLGVEIAAWQARRRPRARVCSLRDLQRFLADPAHPTDKEALERVIRRAEAARLPAGVPCVRFRWDTISGRIERAEVIASEGWEDPVADHPGDPTAELPTDQEDLAA